MSNEGMIGDDGEGMVAGRTPERLGHDACKMLDRRLPG